MFHALRHALLKFLRDRGGNVAIISALALPVVLGAFGIGAEAASWIATKRALQNAADAAAIAAATNGGSNYADEARAVVAQYGFTEAVNSLTVAASNSATCPAGAGPGPCYSVTITRTQPVLLAQVTGFGGDATLNGSPVKLIRATAIASQGTTKRPYCLLALGTSGSGPALHTNGAPDADLVGCNVMSNNDATCNGHDLNADVGDAHGANNGCGVLKHSNVPTATDDYAALASNIPVNPCSAYPQESAGNGNGNGNGNNNSNNHAVSTLPVMNQAAGNIGWMGTKQICGDLQLTGDTTITFDTTLVIYNGQLDTNGYTLRTAPDAHITIIFAGDNGSYTHAPTGGGTLDIEAPKAAGTWKGVAMYQAPNLTTGVDMSAAGNSPTWDVTGIAYFPRANITFSGAVNKSSNGKSCFGMIVNNILINGTGSILAHGQCEDAGVTLPTSDVPGRGTLVQ